ncbi:MAG TPA: ATP-binding protein [Candidatus Dormibacteraeota bacterium]|nr:ATP-binding protein [Candidatus Dormibacteraeota bacterium]
MDTPQKIEPQEILASRTSFYEQATRFVRWLVIAIVILTYAFIAPNEFWELSWLIVSALVYNIGMHIPVMLKQKWFVSKPLMIGIDNVFTLSLLYLTGGADSPYYSILVFMLISAGFWWGTPAVFIVSAGQTAGILAVSALLGQFNPIHLTGIALRCLIFTCVGLYAARLTRAERNERVNLSKISVQIDQERQRLLALINNMVDAVLVVSKEGRIILHNQMALHMMGNQKIADQSINELLRLTDAKNRPVEFNQIQKSATGSVKRRDLGLKMPDGSLINIEVNLTPYIVAQGDKEDNKGFVMVVRDITREKTLEQQQEEFISVASHELRTPVAIAEANISTALLPAYASDNKDTLRMMNQAHRNIKFLGDIITDLTTLSKAEQDILDVDLDPIDAGAFIEQIKSDHKEEAAAKNLEIKTEYPAVLAPVLSSEYRVKEILHNFVTNAIKYTKKGSVTISAKYAENPKDGIIFGVTDTGIGIASADQKKIFTKFFRSEDFRTRETGGTGLGLYIVKKLADRLNGEVWFESELNQGSTFYLRVPPYSQLKKDHSKVVVAETKSFFGSL